LFSTKITPPPPPMPPLNKIMNSILFRQRLWESFPTQTGGKLSNKLCGNFCLNCSKIKFLFSFFYEYYIDLHTFGKSSAHTRESSLSRATWAQGCRPSVGPLALPLFLLSPPAREPGARRAGSDFFFLPQNLY
jgi:hypothetical protein